jgi:sarcosine oxidase, subunit gamma
MTRRTDLPPMTKTLVRARGEAVATAGAAVALVLPIEPLTSVVASDRRALWLGPDTWLVLGGGRTEAPLPAGVALVDVSDAYTGVLLAGGGARDVLACGCRLDLHPAAMPAGFASRTLLGRIEVILHRAADGADGPVFWLLAGRSLGAYLDAWLLEAGREVGLAR